MEKRNLIYKELSYKVVGCCYEVYNEIGPTHKEQVYQESLKLAFVDKKISFEEKKRLKIRFKGKTVGIYEPDFIIEDKIIMEIKSVLNIPKVFENQLYYYLRGSNYKLGYLINFGNEHLDVRRRIYDLARNEISVIRV